jgi:hypothetical protein
VQEKLSKFESAAVDQAQSKPSLAGTLRTRIVSCRVQVQLNSGYQTASARPCDGLGHSSLYDSLVVSSSSASTPGQPSPSLREQIRRGETLLGFYSPWRKTRPRSPPPHPAPVPVPPRPPASTPPRRSSPPDPPPSTTATTTPTAAGPSTTTTTTTTTASTTSRGTNRAAMTRGTPPRRGRTAPRGTRRACCRTTWLAGSSSRYLCFLFVALDRYRRRYPLLSLCVS